MYRAQPNALPSRSSAFCRRRRTSTTSHLAIGSLVLLLLPLLSTVGCSLTPRPATNLDHVPLVPREIFFGNPDKAAVRLSPDGTHLAYLAPHRGVLNIWVMDVTGGAAKAITQSADKPIRRYQWARNSQQLLYLQDEGGNENTHVFVVELSTGDVRDLTPGEDTRAQIVATDRRRPDHVLVSTNARDPRVFDTVEINTRSGETRVVFENDSGYMNVIPDDDWVVRGRVRMTPTGGSVIELRDSADAPWYSFAEISREDAMNTYALGFTKSGDQLWMADSRGRDTSALTLTTPQPDGNGPTEVIFQGEKSDLVDSLENEVTGVVEAVATSYFKREWHFLDEGIEQEFELLSQLCPGEISVTSRSDDDHLWTVAFVTDNGPLRYFLWDRRSKQARFLFTNREQLEDLQLATMQTVEIEARDGMKLPSYLTTPVGLEPVDLPLVLMVHGGPWARDQWGFRPDHQWLANRGYAVLSVNFRGSQGFGKRFVNAGDRQWYKSMQDDLVDAVQWAVDEGIADPQRVAIMGGSYGGYATLAGLTRDPELFACGVDIVGPSHIKTLLESIPPYWAPMLSMFETRVGKLSETEFLDSISPLTHVDRIERPLLIAQGANDPRVKIQESDQIVAAMKERNIPVTYVVFPDEGHGFSKPNNNMAFMAITETFLARHLGGRCEPLQSELSNSSVDIREVGDLELELPSTSTVQ